MRYSQLRSFTTADRCWAFPTATAFVGAFTADSSRRQECSVQNSLALIIIRSVHCWSISLPSGMSMVVKRKAMCMADSNNRHVKDLW